MNSPVPNLSLADILERTIDLTWTASGMLREYYRGSHDELDVRDKAQGPVTIADEAVDRYLLAGIRSICGDSCGYLTEETHQMTDKAIPQDWIWIVDPLDGTRDFIDKTGEYAIHIALTYQQRPVLAVVAVPESQRLYAAILGGGTWRIGTGGVRESVHVTQGRKLTELVVVASRNHRNAGLVQILAQLPCRQERVVGSIGCKVAAIVEGDADVYVSVSGKSAPKDWDFAAPELILTEAGGKFTDREGHPLLYNTGDVSQWGCLIASNGKWHQELLDCCTLSPE